MKKTITITMDENSITFEGSEGTTYADALVVAINLIEEVKEKTDLETKNDTMSLEDFAVNAIRGLKSEEKIEE